MSVIDKDYINVLLVQRQDDSCVVVTAPPSKNVKAGDLVLFDGGKFGTVVMDSWFGLDSKELKILTAVAPTYKAEFKYTPDSPWEDTENVDP